MIYTPREDSFLIEREILKLAKNKNFLDMGCGSGILGNTAIKSGAKKVLFVDINPKAIAILKNKGLNAITSDLFSKVTGKFDLISFNPPYLPEDKRESKESALATTGGKSGDEILLRFMNDVSKYLSKQGEILLLLSSLTPIKRFNLICKKKGFFVDKIASQKFDFEEIFVLLLKQNAFKQRK